VIALGGFATSVTDRNLMGADAWSNSHVIGNEIGGDGGTAAEVSGVAEDGSGAGVGLDEGELGRGGRVTKVAQSEPAVPGQRRRWERGSSCVWGGKDSSFEFLR
jgi:hypothetical protein